MLAVLAIHLTLAVGVGIVTTRVGRGALWAAVAGPVSALVLGLGSTSAVLDGDIPRVDVAWIPGLEVSLTLVMTPLAWAMTLLIGLVGIGVMAFTAEYAKPTVDGARLVVLLTLFAAAMLGLVWAGEAWTLFVFWEATTVCSFLLIGGSGASASAVRAARHSLVVTGIGGLALLGGLVILADQVGSTDLTAIASAEPRGLGLLGALLLLVAAATKSALWPFSGWLPGAMAAPTPVSAFLHSATMVKAGVLLLVLVGPVFATAAAWQISLLVTAGAALLWGGWKALQCEDLKLLLAYSTVSQLGLIGILAGIGDAHTTFAAVAVLLSHGLFKAALFLGVGATERLAGTRDRHELAGVGRRHPLLATVMVLTGMSMAGLPPLAGFVAKEVGIEALLGVEGPAGVAGLLLVVVGSALTVAYTARLLGPYLRRGNVSVVAPVPRGMLLGPVSLAAASVAGGLWAVPLTVPVAAAAATATADAGAFKLKLVPGFTTALGVTTIVIVAGLSIHAWWEGDQRRALRDRFADHLDRALDGVSAASRLVTGRIQHGVLPRYLVTTLLATCAPPLVLLLPGMPDRLDPLDAVGLVVLGTLLVVLGAAVAATRRLTAVLAVGAAGYVVAVLFVLAGAPDVALTQILVETVVVIAFVLVLRRVPAVLDVRGDVGGPPRLLRAAVATVVGGLVTLIGLAAPAGRVGQPATGELLAASPDAGGANVVNIVLTNFRALDTMAEITVILCAVVGVMALVGAPRPSKPSEVDGEVPLA